MITSAAVAGALTTAAGFGLYRRLAGRRGGDGAVILYYHAGFSGRCEGPMLLLEDVAASYELSADMDMPSQAKSCFAPPYCIAPDGTTLSHPTAICLFLGQRHGVAGEEHKLASSMQAALNAEDFWSEAYRAAQGGQDPAAGVAFAASDRFPRWLLVLQAPLDDKEEEECRKRASALQQRATPAEETTEWTRSIWERREEDAAEEERAAEEGRFWAGEVWGRGHEDDAEQEAEAATQPEGEDEGEEDGDEEAAALRRKRKKAPPEIYAFGSKQPTFVDYHLLATMRAAEFMYPKAMAAQLERPELRLLREWRERMLGRPRLAKFLEKAPPVLYEELRGLA